MTREFLLIAFCALTFSSCGGQAKVTQGPLDSLVEAERAFAATSVKEGIRASFMKFFADSGRAFSPAPYLYKQVAAQSPAPTNPLAGTLYWEPIAGDISLAGDMGYTTGPYSLTDNSPEKGPTRYGFFFSVWKVQDDGSWKVVADFGATATQEVARFFGKKFSVAGHDGLESAQKDVDISVAREKLLQNDKASGYSATPHDRVRAYSDILDAKARLLREGMLPIVGKDSILAYEAGRAHGMYLDPQGADVSKSGDFGYTYGAYRTDQNVTNPSGFYLRVWKVNSKGLWKLVSETEAPAPEGK